MLYVVGRRSPLFLVEGATKLAGDRRLVKNTKRRLILVVMLSVVTKKEDYLVTATGNR